MAALLSRLRSNSGMGNCEGNPAEMARRNRIIEDAIERDRKYEESVVKLLLLGAAESGKSTLLKQMKIIHDNGFTREELLQKRDDVCGNVVSSMLAIVDGMVALGVPFGNHRCVEAENLLRDLVRKKEEHAPLAEATYLALRQLWADKGVQVAFSRKNEYYLQDSAEYFFDQLDRIYEESYVPTPQDLLHTRVATMGVIEVSFNMKNKHWRVFDVGGQRSQRKKWIHCFDDAKAVIFVVAMSEYDQVLLEDGVTNRMRESLQLFKEVCNNKHFINTNMILFLNKKDLFSQKIGTIPLKNYFRQFPGPETYEAAAQYIEDRFLAQNKNKAKSIYCHQTCATDTEQVEFVLDSTLDTILSAKLKGCGLY